jgi:hypothetical protein
MCSFDVAKPGSLDLDAWVTGSCSIDDFLANVLSLSITIGPDDKELGVLGLVGQVLGNGLFVLARCSVNNLSERSWVTHIVHLGHDRCVEERLGRRVTPILVILCKVDVGQVAGDTRHGGIASPPRSTKIKIERVVFDELVARVVLRDDG